MKRFSVLSLAFVFVVMLVLSSERAMAQYTGEFIFCTDPTDAGTCRATTIPPDADGVVIWDRAVNGNIVCAGVGFVPQDTDCNFTGNSFLGHDCTGMVLNQFSALVPAGGDLAIACSNTMPLPPGNYSAKATGNDCFGGESDCRNLTLVNIAP